MELQQEEKEMKEEKLNISDLKQKARSNPAMIRKKCLLNFKGNKKHLIVKKTTKQKKKNAL